MRPPPLPPLPPPPPAELAALPAHVVVRDFPETLAVFRHFGISLARHGGAPVSASVDGDAGPLLDALEAAMAWRGAAVDPSPQPL